jgi:PAS domain S-box-containing protein
MGARRSLYRAALLMTMVFARWLAPGWLFRERPDPFRALADAAPVMLRVVGLSGECLLVNRGWLDFTGRRREEELGRGWVNGVHPDDRHEVQAACEQATRGVGDFSLEYRLRARDGDYHWILDSGVSWYGARGDLAGYVASAADVSERKRAQDMLRDVSGRLIAAQEEERRRIARELHDDLSQRLALLSVELEHLGLEKAKAGGRDDRWKTLSRSAGDIATDLHRISHRLHPTRLEALGLVAAISGFCHELWSQHHLQVRFTHDSVPRIVPGDVALCLFRIVQEALQNVITHSGVLEAEVHLAGTRDGLSLRVSDPGDGFALERSEGVGLGLLTMRERVHSLGGEIAFQTAPGRGTRIGVRISLQPTVGAKERA